jgi:tRNA A64-2'-O-ribosylphosphate transferase
LPTPVLKVRGRLLLCTVVDLPRELPANVPSAYEPDNDGEIETAFIVVYASNITPGDTDKTSPIEPRSDDSRGTRANTELGLGEDEGTSRSRVLRMHLPPLGKRGQHLFVHNILPRAVSFASSHLSQGRKLCVAGGGDEGIGVALVLLQLFFDDEGSLRSGIMPSGACSTATAGKTGKSSVRTRLEWIIASRPQVNPSRTILKRVNDFLLSSRSHHRQDGVE